MKRWLIRAAWIAAIAYSVVHFVYSGVLFALRTPNVGQVVEELQPLYRLFTTGVASVDHPRQYGPVFLFLLHPVYRLDLSDPTLLSWYAYALDLVAIGVGFYATVSAIRTWAAARGAQISRQMVIGLALLWANFSPLYGVLAIKNIEIWELSLIAVAGAAMLRGRRWIVASAIGAAALIKMLPLVFLPYLFLRDRKTFMYALVAIAVILTAAQVAYGTAMGFGYFPAMLNAAAGNEGYGNPTGMIWHENVSLRGVVLKAFGYLERPDRSIPNVGYTRGFYVVIPAALQPIAKALALIAQASGLLWAAWMLFRRRTLPDPSRTFWDWAFVAIMMLVLAPQISQDYMVLTLGAFSFVMAGCMLARDRRLWIEFAIATLLVGNVLPRDLFSRLVLIDPIVQWTRYDHLIRAEAYQYFGFPLLGLLILTHVWLRLSSIDRGGATAAPHLSP